MATAAPARAVCVPPAAPTAVTAITACMNVRRVTPIWKLLD